MGLSAFGDLGLVGMEAQGVTDDLLPAPDLAVDAGHPVVATVPLRRLPILFPSARVRG